MIYYNNTIRFPRYQLQRDYSVGKHGKTLKLQNLAGVLLGQGWAAYLIILTGIPLNPLSVSESRPEAKLNGQTAHDMRFFRRWFLSIEWRDSFTCGISDGDIGVYNVLSSEVRVSV